MKRKAWYTTFLFVILFSGCDSSPPSPVTVNVITESSVIMDITGDWHSDCRTGTPNDYKHVIRFMGTEVYVDKDIYQSSDLTCATLVRREKDERYFRNIDAHGAEATVVGTIGIRVWYDSNGSATSAPNGLAGPPLQNNPTASKLDVTSGNPFIPFRWTLFVDDTDSMNDNYAFYFTEIYEFNSSHSSSLNVSRVYRKVR